MRRILDVAPGAVAITQTQQKGQAVVIFNPTAGRKRGREAASGAGRRLHQLGWEVTTHGTKAPGHGMELARSVDPEVGRVVAIGGDGTLREVAEGLGSRASEVELGFVPMGNANVVARELGIPLQPQLAIDVATNGTPKPFDALRANGRFVLAMVGVGYDGVVTRWVDRSRRGALGGAWYGLHADSLYGALGCLSLFVPAPRFQLEVDGERMPSRYGHLTLCNIETYAKGWAMTPGADPSDGHLDYQARKRTSAPFGVWSLLAAWRSRRVPRFISDYGRGRRFLLSSTRPFSWQADGDPMGRTNELEVEVLPAALRILAPRA